MEKTFKRLIPINTAERCAITIKAQYGKNSIVNFFRRGGYAATGILETNGKDETILLVQRPDIP